MTQDQETKAPPPLDLEVEVDGEKHSVRVKTTDFVRFEREYGISFTEVDESTFRLEHIYWLAWTACRRLKLTDIPFEEWLDHVDEVESNAVAPLDGSNES